MQEITEIIVELKVLERRVQDLKLAPTYTNHQKESMYLLNMSIYFLHELKDALSGEAVMGMD